MSCRKSATTIVLVVAVAAAPTASAAGFLQRCRQIWSRVGVSTKTSTPPQRERPLAPFETVREGFFAARDKSVDSLEREEKTLKEAAREVTKLRAALDRAPTGIEGHVKHELGKAESTMLASARRAKALREKLAAETLAIGNDPRIVDKIEGLEIRSSGLRGLEAEENRKIAELTDAAGKLGPGIGKSRIEAEIRAREKKRDELTKALWENQEALGSLRAARYYALHVGLSKKSVTWTDRLGRKRTNPLVAVVDELSPSEVRDHFAARGKTPMYGARDLAWTLEMKVPDQVLVELMEAKKISLEEYTALKMTRKYGGPHIGLLGEFFGVDRNYRRREINGQVDATPDLASVLINTEDTWAHWDPLISEDGSGMRFLMGSIGAMGPPQGDPKKLEEYRKDNWGMAGHGGAFQASVGGYDRERGGNALGTRDPSTGLFGIRFDAKKGDFVPYEKGYLQPRPVEPDMKWDEASAEWVPASSNARTRPFLGIVRNVPSLKYSAHSRLEPEYGVYHLLNLGEAIRNTRQVLRAHYRFQRLGWDPVQKKLVGDPSYRPSEAKRKAPLIDLTPAELEEKERRLAHYRETVGVLRLTYAEIAQGMRPDRAEKIKDFDLANPVIKQDLKTLDEQIRELEEVVKADTAQR